MGEAEPGGAPRRKRATTAADPRLPADVLRRLAAEFGDRPEPEGAAAAEGGSSGRAGQDAAPGDPGGGESGRGDTERGNTGRGDLAHGESG
jgi:hypothetical protein